MTKVEKQFRAAMAHWDSKNPTWHAAGNAIIRHRRAAFAAMWFIENVDTDANGRTDVFFLVREIYRESLQ